jgi:hypothetical protein
VVTRDAEALKERARNLDKLNGLRMVLVRIVPAVPPAKEPTAELEVRLWNTNHVAEILSKTTNNTEKEIDLARKIFPITGGSRRVASPDPGDVNVTGVAKGTDPDVIVLTVGVVGDYSTYTLWLEYDEIDPVFSSLPFRFRPGCFTTDCEPGWCAPDEPGPAPAIDYLARDYDSFKHTLIAAMMARVPGWRPTSEADLDETLIELLSVRGDELADLQDRIMAEATLATSRKRVSLARHGRLMDYHIHQGSQASTWLMLTVANGVNGDVPAGLTSWTTGTDGPDGTRQDFVTAERARVHSQLNRVRFHTWSRTTRSLDARATEADLLLDLPNEATADAVRDLIRTGKVGHLVIEETRDPATCVAVGFDRHRRQLLTLVPEATRIIHDPDPKDPQNANSGTWVLHVGWLEPLEHDYCIVSECERPSKTIADDVSVIRGNVVRAFHGRSVTDLAFYPPTVAIDPTVPANDRKRSIEVPTDACSDVNDECRPGAGGRLVGAICRLPIEDAPLAYRSTPAGGEVPPCSTLEVRVGTATDHGERWTECPSLVHSLPGDHHFVVETDELGHSLIRFGNGKNGQGLPEQGVVWCNYQVGWPLDGNVGGDSITNLEVGVSPLLDGATVRNPFDVTDGLAPEPVAEIIRRIPEAYRARQLRAVTLADYARRASEVEGVQRAAARYSWTGSWRTVQVTIDPAGDTRVREDLRRRVLRHLSTVRLIGEDIEVRAPRWVPLDIEVVVCIDAAFWLNDVRFVIEQAFSDGLDQDGRKAFFHPDRWTFGQGLHASQIAGRLDDIAGVDHVTSIRMRRFDAPTPPNDATVAVRANEILQVRNDPDRREAGSIAFQLQGGRA